MTDERTGPITSAELAAIRQQLREGVAIKAIATLLGFGDIRTFDLALCKAGWAITTRLLRIPTGATPTARNTAYTLTDAQLDEGRRLIESDGKTANEAAHLLGYKFMPAFIAALARAGFVPVRVLDKTPRRVRVATNKGRKARA